MNYKRFKFTTAGNSISKSVKMLIQNYALKVTYKTLESFKNCSKFKNLQKNGVLKFRKHSKEA